MDSSDSEDDCYGNIASKLQSMKNKYVEDKIKSSNLLNDSEEIDDIVDFSCSPAKTDIKSSPKKKLSSKPVPKEDSFVPPTDILPAVSSRRVTRAASKRTSSEAVVTENSPSKRTNKRKKKSDVANTESTSSSSTSNARNSNRNEVSSTNRRSRGRGRGRGRIRGRSSRSPVTNISYNIPTYSVGNTDEYPDQSDNQQLFSMKNTTNDVILVDENDAFDENEELSVKVYWQSSEIFKFTIRRYQKLSQIFDYFANKENVSNDKLFFTLNDHILKPDDTPDSINYSIVKFIDGGIVNQSVSNLVKTNEKGDSNGIKLKFQCQNVKKPFETTIGLNDTLSLAMMKCAEHFEIPLEKLKFQFDGDAITGKTTARDLELEGGECIDVKIVS